MQRLDYSHVLNRFALEKLPTGPKLQDMMGKMAFCIHGYDEDPRELHMIPEVRRFYKTFTLSLPRNPCLAVCIGRFINHRAEQAA